MLSNVLLYQDLLSSLSATDLVGLLKVNSVIYHQFHQLRVLSLTCRNFHHMGDVFKKDIVLNEYGVTGEKSGDRKRKKQKTISTDSEVGLVNDSKLSNMPDDLKHLVFSYLFQLNSLQCETYQSMKAIVRYYQKNRDDLEKQPSSIRMQLG